MLAVDTNIVVRYVVRDDAAQSERARRVVEAGPVLVTPTVILESEWVLRSLYGFSPSEVVTALEGFCGTPNIEVGEASAVRQALNFAKHGMDFADALHLAQAVQCDAFVTFDRKLARKARGVGGVAVRLA